jgi:selenocysteine lyase/cysteine desulfurase
MAIKGSVRTGDHVITSVLEHNSVSRPLERLARDGRIKLTRLPATVDHRIDPDAVVAAWTPKTRLLALTHASNVTGTIQPVAAFGRIARERGGLLLVDAAQSAGVVPIDVQADAIDLLAFTGHKGLLGPTGTGGLVVGERADVTPWREGGTGGDSSSPVQPAELPFRLEAGTPNVIGIAGLREGVRIVLERGPEDIAEHERGLLMTFLEAVERPGLFSFYGADAVLRERAGAGRVGLLSFNLDGFAPEELAALLDDRYGIAVRSGLHCAPYAHRHLSSRDDMLRAASALNELAAG